MLFWKAAAGLYPLIGGRGNAIGHPLSLDSRTFQVLWRISLLPVCKQFCCCPDVRRFPSVPLETFSMFCSVDFSGDTRSLVPKSFPNNHQVLAVSQLRCLIVSSLTTIPSFKSNSSIQGGSPTVITKLLVARITLWNVVWDTILVKLLH